jgi:hypothetical protein
MEKVIMTCVYVGLAVLGVLVLAIVVLKFVVFPAYVRKHKPRLQFYMFVHRLLPELVFADAAGVVMPLVASATKRSDPQGVEMLRRIWAEADMSADPADKVAWDPKGFDVTVLENSPRTMVVVLPMPEPIKRAEAYHVVIAVDSVSMAVGEPTLLRYFVMELMSEKDGVKKTCLSEWRKGDGELKYELIQEGGPELKWTMERIRELVAG